MGDGDVALTHLLGGAQEGALSPPPGLSALSPLWKGEPSVCLWDSSRTSCLFQSIPGDTGEESGTRREPPGGTALVLSSPGGRLGAGRCRVTDGDPFPASRAAGLAYRP